MASYSNPPASDNVHLLDRLLGSPKQSRNAWEEFLRQYSNLILKIVWQFERGHDDAMEKYLPVCEQLAANGFAILRRFRREFGTTPPKFTTWLAAVVRNLCVDAHRSVHGRRRFPVSLTVMSEYDRAVFELFYWKGHSPEEIHHLLRNLRNGLNESVPETLQRIQDSLTRDPAEFSGDD